MTMHLEDGLYVMKNLDDDKDERYAVVLDDYMKVYTVNWFGDMAEWEHWKNWEADLADYDSEEELIDEQEHIMSQRCTLAFEFAEEWEEDGFPADNQLIDGQIIAYATAE